jgi:hypothetical protein
VHNQPLVDNQERVIQKLEKDSKSLTKKQTISYNLNRVVFIFSSSDTNAKTMKLSFCTFLLSAVSTAAIIIGVDSKQVGTPVRVEVKCNGLDIEKLDAVSGTVLTHILEESYGKVRGTKGKDLTITSFRSARIPKRPSWTCGPLCPDDDNVDLAEDDTATTYWNGQWECDATTGALCVPETNEHKDAVTTWEEMFVWGLVETRRMNFRAVESCDITLQPTTQ